MDKRPKIRLDFTSPKGYHRQLLVTMDSQTSNGFDLGYDAPLIENNTEDIYWILNGGDFIIQGVPHFKKDQELPLGIKIGADTEFTISIGRSENLPDQWDIFLKDSLSDELHDLRESDYRGSLEPARIHHRFKLVFTDEEPVQDGQDDEDPQEEEEEEIISGDLEIFYVHDSREIIIHNPQLLNISQVRINNILGQQIKTLGDIPAEKQTRYSMARYGAGVYIVTLISETSTITRKFILK